ncbi:FAD-dependent oxidoreductase, partial [Acinetobacter baumannii]
KEEFSETLRYFRRRLDITGVDLKVNTRVTADDLGGFDEVLLATGVSARDPKIKGQAEGVARGQVLSYIDVLRHDKPVGARVAIVGAGGI